MGDCLSIPGSALCRDNNTGDVVACSAAACSLPGIARAGAPVQTWQPQGVACMPKQYTPDSPAPFPPKDPCTIQNAYPCLPAGWPAPNSGYYDGDPGVPPCGSFSGPTSFGIPVAAYVAAAPLMAGLPATPPPPPQTPPPSPPPGSPPMNYQPVLTPPAPPPPATQSNGQNQGAVGAGAGQSNATNAAFVMPSFVTADSLIAGVPNWLLGLGAFATLFFLKGR